MKLEDAGKSPKTEGAAFRVLLVVEPRGEQLLEHVLALAAHFPRREFDVTVVGNLERAFQDTLSRHSVRWVRTDWGKRAAEATDQMARLIATRKSNVVHAHGPAAAEVVAKAMAGRKDRPLLVYTAHELSGFETGAFSLSWRARGTYRRLLGKMDSIIVQSQRDRQALGALAPEVVARAEVIPPGVDTRRVRHLLDPGHKKEGLGIGMNSAVVGIVADLDEPSGMETFLRAAAQVNEEMPNIEFVIVGDGPLREKYEELAHRLRLGGAALFLGRRADLPEVLATFNVAVVTTEAGGGTQTALQALTLELPVVAQDTGGLREVLGQVEGLPLVTPGDPEALATAIMDALEIVPEARPGEWHGTVSATGIGLSMQDMLVSTEAFNLDRPGLEPEERKPAKSPGAVLARKYGVGLMVRRTVALYRRLMKEHEGESG
jgi:glycosyltransferase involved in cell wall biosynthesis